MQAATDGSTRKIQLWFQKVLATCGHKQSEIAALLDLPSSAISKIKSGQQNLGAAELLKLHESLNVPLPDLGYRGKGDRETAPQPAPRGIDRALFDAAFDQVEQTDRLLPEHQRMNQHEVLETVFYVYRKMAKEKHSAWRKPSDD